MNEDSVGENPPVTVAIDQLRSTYYRLESSLTALKTLSANHSEPVVRGAIAHVSGVVAQSQGAISCLLTILSDLTEDAQ